MRRGSGLELWAQVAQIKSQKRLPPGMDFHQPCPPPWESPRSRPQQDLGSAFAAPFCRGALSNGPRPLSLVLLFSLQVQGCSRVPSVPWGFGCPGRGIWEAGSPGKGE